MAPASMSRHYAQCLTAATSTAFHHDPALYDFLHRLVVPCSTSHMWQHHIFHDQPPQFIGVLGVCTLHMHVFLTIEMLEDASILDLCDGDVPSLFGEFEVSELLLGEVYEI